MSLLALLAQTTAETTPQPGIDVTALTQVRHVTNHAAWWRTSTATGIYGRWQVTQHTVRATATDLRVQYGVHGWAGADAGITGRAGIVANGDIHWLTWNGEQTVTVPRLEARVSDPLEGVVVPEGATIYSVWEGVPESVMPSGVHHMTYPVSSVGYGPYDGSTSATSQSIAGAPQAILGKTMPTDRAASVALLGDSFVEQKGWGHHGLEEHGVAWTDLSQWAEGTPSGLPAARFPLTDPFPYDVIITAYGGNNSSSDFDAQAQVHIQHWTALRATGAEVAAMTLHPYSDSTDKWVTLEGQTPREGHRSETRLLRNDWLRDGAPIINGAAAPTGTDDPAAVRAGQEGHPVTLGFFDQAAATQHPDNPLVWRVDGGAWTGDGAHLTAHGATSLTPIFSRWVKETIPARV